MKMDYYDTHITITQHCDICDKTITWVEKVTPFDADVLAIQYKHLLCYAMEGCENDHADLVSVVVDMVCDGGKHRMVNALHEQESLGLLLLTMTDGLKRVCDCDSGVEASK